MVILNQRNISIFIPMIKTDRFLSWRRMAKAKKEKDPRGGKRPGAGRPSEYKETLVTISTKVPASQVEAFRQMAKEWLAQFKVPKA